MVEGYQNLRYSVRALIRTPAFALTIIAVLTLGIGANATMLSLLHRILFGAPPGVADAGRISRLYFQQQSQAAPVEVYFLNAAGIDYLAKELSPLATVTAYAHAVDVRIGRGEGAHAVTAHFVRANYFSFLGVIPEHGRFYHADERSVPGAPRAVVVSDRLWKRLGADLTLVGAPIELNGNKGVVVGIAPEIFAGVDNDAPDAWMLLPSTPFPIQLLTRSTTHADAIGSRATAIVRRLARDRRSMDSTITVTAGPLHIARMPHLRSQQMKVALQLGGVSLALLLLACANVANLSLARAVQRRREAALRIAIGASRARVFTLFMTDIAVLAVISGIAATLIALGSRTLLQDLLFPRWHWHGIGFDWFLPAFVAAATMFATLSSGVFSAWRLSAVEPSLAGRESGAQQRSDQGRLRHSFVAIQSGLTISLLVLAVLFLGSLRNITALDLGYDVDELTYGTIYHEGPVLPMFETMRRIADRMQDHPDVAMVALARRGPFNGVGNDDVFLPGRDSALTFRNGRAAWLGISNAFFQTVGLPVLAGRPPGAEDDRSGAHIVWVNRQMATELWPGADPLGKCLVFATSNQSCYVVVGIVGDSRQYALTEQPIAAYYIPLLSLPYPENPATEVIVKTKATLTPSVLTTLRAEMVREFPNDHYSVRSLSDILWRRFQPWYANALLLAAFAFLGLTVAVVGIYGAVSYSVAQRRRELGIRLSLGAHPRSLIWLVMREEMRPMIVGLLVGLGVMLWINKFVQPLLYGISLTDWTPMVLAAILLLVVAAVASLLPTRTISQLAPDIVLRAE